MFRIHVITDSINHIFDDENGIHHKKQQKKKIQSQQQQQKNQKCNRFISYN